MIKFLPFFLLIFLLGVSVSAIAQDRTTSDTTIITNGSDSTVANSVDSAGTADNIAESLYQPVADSLSSPTAQMREVPEIQVNRYKSSPDYAYANDPQYWQKEKRQEPGVFFKIFFSPTLWWILLAVFGGLGLYGIYQLAKENNFNLLIRRGEPHEGGTEEDSAEEKMDFDEAIAKSQSEGDYRMAIRFLYLRLIQLLRDKGDFAFRDSSTNAEIANAMGKHPQVTSFRWLATAYEYTFYGGFHPNRDLYETLKTEFETFQKNLFH